jgi:hypothetical protein
VLFRSPGPNPAPPRKTPGCCCLATLACLLTWPGSRYCFLSKTCPATPRMKPGCRCKLTNLLGKHCQAVRWWLITTFPELPGTNHSSEATLHAHSDESGTAVTHLPPVTQCQLVHACPALIAEARGAQSLQPSVDWYHPGRCVFLSKPAAPSKKPGCRCS